MPVPRLRVEDAALLVIDVQEALMPTIAHGDRIAANCAVLIRMADTLGLPYLVTEQYPKGLGHTVDVVAGAIADRASCVEKTRFSAVVEPVEQRLLEWGRGSILVAGVEAHVCVLQTVLDLHARGRQCFVCTDAVSAGQPDQISHAFSRMERTGAVLTGVLSAMYELLGDSSHPAFRTCLTLAKAVV